MMAVSGWKKARSVIDGKEPEIQQEPVEARSATRLRGRYANFDWKLAEKLFLVGEPKRDEAGNVELDVVGMPIMVRPNQNEIARRIGCSFGAVSLHVTRHMWKERREKLDFEAKVRREQAEDRSRALETFEPTAILDEFIQKFAAAVKSGKVRDDDVGAFDKACRLRAFLRADAEQKSAVKQVVTLEAMQARHAAARARAQRADAVTAGVTHEGERNVDSPDAGEAGKPLVAANGKGKAKVQEDDDD